MKEYKYIKSISYAIGTIERKASCEKKYQIRQQKEVSATAR